MEQNNLSDARYVKMTTAPIAKLILSMSVPAIASMIITSLYNMADTYFVSRLGTSVAAAPGIAQPLFLIIQAISLALAVGSGSFAARALGQRNNEAANRSVSTAFFVSIIIGTVIGVASLIFLSPLMTAFGATETILPHAYDYAFWVIVATPFFSATFVLAQAIRQEGSVRLAVIGTVAGAVVNVVLDPILIFGFDMGITGAAVATSISQIVSFLILFFYILRGHCVLKISFKYFTPNWRTLSEILKIGSPDFFRAGLASIAAILLNNAAAVYGDVALAGMTVCTRIIHIIVAVLMGFGQGFQPMCGYCYGAKLYTRIEKGLRFTMSTGLAIMMAVTVLGIAFAKPVMALFRPGDAEFIDVGAQIFRAQLTALPMATVTIVANMLFQSCGKAVQSATLALARNGIFFIPLILVLPRLWQFTGVIFAQPISDMITFAIALVMMIGILREFKRGIAEQQAAGTAGGATLPEQAEQAATS